MKSVTLLPQFHIYIYIYKAHLPYLKFNTGLFLFYILFIYYSSFGSTRKSRMWFPKLSLVLLCFTLLSLFQSPAFAIKKVKDNGCCMSQKFTYSFLLSSTSIYTLFGLVLTDIFFFFLFISFLVCEKPYIVYLGSHAQGPQVSKADLNQVANSHYEFLGSFLGRHV